MNNLLPEMCFRQRGEPITTLDKTDNIVRFIGEVTEIDESCIVHRIATKNPNAIISLTEKNNGRIREGDFVLVFAKVIRDGEVEGRADVISQKLVEKIEKIMGQIREKNRNGAKN